MLATGRIITPAQVWPLSPPGSGVALTTSLATVSGSQCCLEASLFTAGATAYYRTVGIFGNGILASDVVETDLVDGHALTTIVDTTATVTSGNTYAVRVQSAWTQVPAALQVAALQVRNQTGARGYLLSAFLEIGYLG